MAGEDDKVSTDATEKGPVIGTIKKDKLKFAKKLKSRLGKKKEQKNAPISGSELAKSQRSKRFVRNIALPISAVVVFTVGAYFLYGFIQDRKTIVIGDSKITHEQRSKYVDQLEKHMAKTGETFDKNSKDVALDALILNAALKDQAKKHSITVSEADIDAALAPDYDLYGGKEAFWADVKSREIDQITPVVRENEVYKQKLEHVLLNRKDIFVVDIHYGSPYFQHYQEHNGDAEPLREKARQLLKDKFLPLFERGATKEEIASLVVDNRVVPNASNVDHGDAPFDETTTVAIMLQSFNRTAGTRFNDEEGDKSIPGVVSANEVAASLKKAGDHTGVVTTLAGTISIMRAEEVRGGDYDSWDDLLAEYRQKYAENKLKLTVTRWSNNVARITENFIGQLSTWLVPRVFATHQNPTPAQCASDFHLVKWKWAARNANTGAYVPGARVSYKRASNYVKTCPNGIKAEAGGSIPKGGYLVTDNCWEHPPDVSFTNPAGYTRANPFATENGGDHFDNNGVPRWDKGKNAIVMEAAILNFLPPPTVSNWQLEGKSYVNEVEGGITVRRGDQLRFKHTVKNTGSVNSSTINYKASWVTNVPDYNLSTIAACNPTSASNEIIAAGGTKFVPSPGAFTCNVPSNAADGTTYCQKVEFTPKSSSNSGTGESSLACATVVDSCPSSGCPPPPPPPPPPCTDPCCTSSCPPPPPPSPEATIVPRAGSGGTVEINTPITFRNWAEVSNTANVPGGDTFTLQLYDGTNNLPGGDWGPNRRSISSGAHPSDQGAYTFTPTMSGTYCRKTQISNYPSYVQTPSGTEAQECWVVREPPRIRAGTDISGILEPGGYAEATAWVTKTVNREVSSQYERVFWYENDGNGQYGSGDQLAGTNLLGIIHIPDFRFNYPTLLTLPPGGPQVPYPNLGDNPISTPPSNPWNTRIPRNTNYKRICTSLKLVNPQPSVTIIEGSNPHVTCKEIVRKPYFQVLNGDVSALSCGGSGSKVSAFNLGALSPTLLGLGFGNYAGSNSTIGVFSQGAITEFASGTNTSPGLSLPKPLTFANSTNPWGGNFPDNYCTPDYWANPTSSGNVTVGNSPNHVVNNGNVFINENYTVGGSHTLGSIPVRWVVTTGNIYISKDVANLDGVYIARGNIYTCSNGFTPYQTGSGSNSMTQCQNQLRVRGSLIAQGSIKLQRTVGTLAIADNPAEIIEYNPLVWIQGINATTPIPVSGSTNGKFDFITSLPPVL